MKNGLLPVFLLAITSLLDFVKGTQFCPRCSVQKLTAEPDFRAAKLTWNYLFAQEPPAFRIKYCELSQWSSKLRCKQRVYPLSRAVNGKGKWFMRNVPPQQYLGKLIRLERGSFQTSILDLRMMTNYSFNVEAEFTGGYNSYNLAIEPPSTSYHPSNREQFPVSVETKGFSGKTITCLGNTSEVAVHTGPYFNGKISVEGSSRRECAIYGNKSSTLDLYTLPINHTLCGSKITNNTRIETMIIVHENKEILTHNSRRFLVICNFPSDTYTLTASVDVPPHLLKKNSRRKPGQNTPLKPALAPSEEFDHRSSGNDSNHILVYDPSGIEREARILALRREPRISMASEMQAKGERDPLLTTSCFFGAIIVCTWILYIIMKRNDSRNSNKSHSLPRIHPHLETISMSASLGRTRRM